ncbi:hypothetical protein HaLaN_30182, partial [Haematococcus lacustris]
MVDHVGQQLQTAFLAGAKFLMGTNEHQRRFGVMGLGGGHLPAWFKRQCTHVRRMVCGLDVSWLLQEEDPGEYIEGPKDSQKLASPKHRYAQTVDTDGVAISVMFLRPKPAGPPADLPRMGKGMGAVNPLAHLHAEWLGVDPSKTKMATVAHEERSAGGSVLIK